MSLRDGTRKMSKSDPSDQSRIGLTDSDELITQKIKRAKTDPLPLPDDVAGLAERPEARNLLGLYAAMAGMELTAAVQEFAGSGWGTFKGRLAELLVEEIAPLRAETARLLADPGHLDAALASGAARARAVADPIVEQAERIVGLLG